MEADNRSRIALGARGVRGDERIYGSGDACSTKKADSDRIIHHRDGGVARVPRAGTQSAQSHDLRFEALPALLPAHAGPADVVRRARSILSRERADDPS